MICSVCKQKMKVVRTIRIDDERTMRINFCDNCNSTVDSIELTCNDFKENYSKKYSS